MVRVCLWWQTLSTQGRHQPRRNSSSSLLLRCLQVSRDFLKCLQGSSRPRLSLHNWPSNKPLPRLSLQLQPLLLALV